MASPVKIFAVAAKTETVKNTDSLPTVGSNAIRIVGPAAIPRTGFLETNERRDAQSGRLGAEGRAASAGRWATISIPTECHGLGSTYGATPNVIDQDPLIRACGFSRAASGSAPNDQVDYTSADLATTCTIYAWSLGMLHVLTGCVGTWTDAFVAGRPVMRTYEMTGILATNPTTATPGAQTLTSVIGPLFSNAALAIGTYDVTAGLQMTAGTFTLGNTIAALPSAGATDAHAGYEISDRAPTFSATMFTPVLASYDVYTKARSGSDAVTLTWGTAASPTYNGQRLALAAWEPGAPDPSDINGLGAFSLSGPVKHNGSTRDVIYSTR